MREELVLTKNRNVENYLGLPHLKTMQDIKCRSSILTEILALR